MRNTKEGATSLPATRAHVHEDKPMIARPDGLLREVASAPVQWRAAWAAASAGAALLAIALSWAVAL